ncbi:hypothetical protein BKA80DRAFT_101667 [Phyllosticta citrichinensis]
MSCQVGHWAALAPRRSQFDISLFELILQSASAVYLRLYSAGRTPARQKKDNNSSSRRRRALASTAQAKGH